MSRSSQKWLIFSGGGTGGHLTQAMAVAEQVKIISPETKIAMMCSARAIDAQVLAKSSVFDRIIAQPILPLPGKTLRLDKWFKFLLKWKLSYKLAAKLHRELKPACVLGFGGFAAAAMIVLAHKKKTPTALLNPDSIPGKANIKLIKYTSQVFIACEMSRRFFMPTISDENIILSGCPVRASILAALPRGDALGKFRLNPAKRVIGVMGGSLGAKNVNDAVSGACKTLISQMENWSVLHICGSGKAGSLQGEYDAMGIEAKVFEFCDQMDAFYSACDLVVARGGANCIAELSATATPSVIMPYPWHKDMHQKHNAAELVESGAAIIVDDRNDTELNSSALADVLAPLLSDPQKLNAMAEAATQCARSDAASKVARKILSL